MQASILRLSRYILPGIFLLFLASGCKTTKEVSTDQQKPTYELVVSFYSIGAGVNAKAYKAFNNLLKEYQDTKKLPMNVEKIHWGREGEVDYCIDLKKLKQKDRNDFINKTKDLLTDQQWVRIHENHTCREGNQVRIVRFFKPFLIDQNHNPSHFPLHIKGKCYNFEFLLQFLSIN